MVEIRERDDGGIEVVEDGRVQWCGRDRAAAGAVIRRLTARMPDAEIGRRHEDNQALPGAIDVMRRG